MQLHTWLVRCLAAALVSLAVFVASVGKAAAQDAVAPPPGADPEGVETLTRGPVHEAFAAPAASDPKPPAVVPKKPPADIDEEQPEFRPEGAIWINGYWEWDPELEDFLWISGLWRVPPPEMRWVPPYWTEVEGGWQRVPGFWVSTAAGELEYRPTPPNSLEVGPSSPAPADNYFYIPGTWNYYDTGYRWRSGYWSPYREDWVWCPSRWVWTPAGCLYQAGFWDHRPLVRAQYFAPIRFTSAVYLTPGWRYRPWCVVDSSRFFVHLWIGPRSNCYYFGNYYGSYGSRFGLTPWCNWSYRSRGCYDPLWSWCNTHYRRQGIDYIGRCRGWHDHFDRHEHERPARTWKDQTRLIADAKLDPRKSQRVLAADLSDVVKRDDLPVKLKRLDDRERASIVKVSDDLRKLNVERLKTEREARLARGRDVLEQDGRDRGDAKTDGEKPGGEKPSVARTGRTPRIDPPKASDKSPRGESPRGDLSGGEKTADADVKLSGKPNSDKPGSGKSDSNKSDSAKVASRVDELNKELAGRSSESKKAAKLKLPEQSDAIREVTRSSRTTARGRDNSPGSGLKETTINLPKRTQGRPRTGVESAGGAAPATAAGSESGSEAGGNSAGNSSRDNRGRTVTRSGGGNTNGNSGDHVGGSTKAASAANPDPKPPKVDASRGSSRPSDAPKIDTPKIEAPKIESRGNRSRENSSRNSQPRISLPTSSSGESGGPKIEARSSRPSGSDSSRALSRPMESRSMEARTSGNSSRIDAPRSSAPRNSAPRNSAPKIESAPRPSPRIEMPRSSQSRSSQSRSSQSRSSESRSMSRSGSSGSSRSMSRSEGSRSSGGGGGGGGNSGSSRSRGRGRD